MIEEKDNRQSFVLNKTHIKDGNKKRMKTMATTKQAMKVTKETFILLSKIYTKGTDEKHLKDIKMIKNTLSNTLYK